MPRPVRSRAGNDHERNCAKPDQELASVEAGLPPVIIAHHPSLPGISSLAAVVNAPALLYGVYQIGDV